MKMTNLLLAIGIISRLGELVERAMMSGRDITQEEMEEAFGRATEANVNWQNAIKGSEKIADGRE